jgi:hypothetical protein
LSPSVIPCHAPAWHLYTFSLPPSTPPRDDFPQFVRCKGVFANAVRLGI